MLPYREYKSDSVLGPMLSAELTVDKALGTKVNGASIIDAVLDEASLKPVLYVTYNIHIIHGDITIYLPVSNQHILIAGVKDRLDSYRRPQIL